MTFGNTSFKVTFWTGKPRSVAWEGTSTSKLEGGGGLLSPGQGASLPWAAPLPIPSARSQFTVSSEQWASVFPAPFLAFPHLVTFASLPGELLSAVWRQNLGNMKQIHGWYLDFSGTPSHSNAKNTIFQEEFVERK